MEKPLSKNRAVCPACSVWNGWEWYFSVVCRQSKRWQQELGFSGSIAVDLFSEQLGSFLLLERIEHLRAESGVSPSEIVLQIGEEVIAKKLLSVFHTMNSLHSAGYILAVVDFGGDDSCLKCLADLPVSLIKIEDRVVRNQWSSEISACYISLMVSAAHRLGVAVDMAGVSAVEQIPVVQSIGCDLVRSGAIWCRVRCSAVPKLRALSMINCFALEGRILSKVCPIFGGTVFPRNIDVCFLLLSPFSKSHACLLGKTSVHCSVKVNQKLAGQHTP